MGLPRHDGTGTGLEALIGSIYTTTLVSTARKNYRAVFEVSPTHGRWLFYWSVFSGAVRLQIYTCWSSTTLTSCAPDHPGIGRLTPSPPIPDVTFHPKLQLVQTRRKLVTPNHPKSIIDLLGENLFETYMVLSLQILIASVGISKLYGKPSHNTNH